MARIGKRQEKKGLDSVVDTIQIPRAFSGIVLIEWSENGQRKSFEIFGDGILFCECLCTRFKAEMAVTT